MQGRGDEGGHRMKAVELISGGRGLNVFPINCTHRMHRISRRLHCKARKQKQALKAKTAQTREMPRYFLVMKEVLEVIGLRCLLDYSSRYIKELGTLAWRFGDTLLFPLRV